MHPKPENTAKYQVKVYKHPKQIKVVRKSQKDNF